MIRVRVSQGRVACCVQCAGTLFTVAEWISEAREGRDQCVVTPGLVGGQQTMENCDGLNKNGPHRFMYLNA